MSNIDRRHFLATTAVGTAGVLLADGSNAAAKSSRIVVVKGTDVKKMFDAGIAKLGGIKRIVQPGKKATIKPNAAWTRRPEQAANTSPQLVGACVAACKSAGATQVIVSENPVDDPEKCFAQSGILGAVKAAGGQMVACKDKKQFRGVTLPKAKSLDSADVAIDVLDTGCLINLPVVKTHSSTGLTCAMKNWMGSVEARKMWHLWNLEQKIADICTLLKPQLIVADAMRVMMSGGPRGPGQVDQKNQLIFGTDPVAVDAYAATLINKKPFEVEHIKIAHEMGIGVGDLKRMEIINVRV